MNIFLFDFKRKLKTALIWAGILSLYALIMIAFFNSMAADSDELMQVVESFPESLREIFEISGNAFTTLEGFMDIEFMFIYTLVSGILGIYLATNLIGNEFTDKTIYFLLNRPTSKEKIFFSKILTSAALLFVINVILLAVTLTSAYALVNIDFPVRYFVYSFSLGFLFQMLFVVLGSSLGLLFRNGKGFFIGISGVVSLWILDAIAKFDQAPDWLIYIIPFHYFDSNYIAHNLAIRPTDILVLFILISIFTIIGWELFRNKNVEM